MDITQNVPANQPANQPTMLVTKEQLVMMYHRMGVVADVPTLKRTTIIAFPLPTDWPVLTVTATKEKSTNGHKLYRMTFSKGDI